MKANDQKIAIVAGGTGNIGIGIVKSLLDTNYKVLVPYRNQQKADLLKQYVNNHENLLLEHIDISDYNNALLFADTVFEEFTQVDLVVAAVGGWWIGNPLTQTDINDYERVVSNTLTSHYTIGRALIPKLMTQGSGTYVAISGPGQVLQIPQSSLMNILGVANVSLYNWFAEESKASGANVYQLFISNIATRERPEYLRESKDWQTPENVGEKIHEIAMGGRAQFPELIQFSMPVEIKVVKKAVENI